MNEGMDLARATPVEIDTMLAKLDREEGSAQMRVAAVIADMHYGLEEKARYITRNRKAWPTTDEQAIEAVRLKAEAGEKMSLKYSRRPFADLYRKYEDAVAEVDRIIAEAEPLNAEFVRRGGWPRYFLAQAHNGHYHSSMNCQTCNKNGQPTSFAWNPEMSGMSEADALAELGRRAAILCSVCFPNAPVEMYSKRPDPDECAGGMVVPGTVKRWGPSRTEYGQCPTCERDGIQVKADGTMRKHKKPTTQDQSGQQ